MSNTTRRSVLGAVCAAFFARFFPRSMKAAPPQTPPDACYRFVPRASPFYDAHLGSCQAITSTYDQCDGLHSVSSGVEYSYYDYPPKPAPAIESNEADQPSQMSTDDKPDENAMDYSI